jgi:hypothetical protein
MSLRMPCSGRTSPLHPDGACASPGGPTLRRDRGRAEELGEILLPAFDTPTGIPLQTLNLRTRAARNPSWTQHSSILSELGTQQVPPRDLPPCEGSRISLHPDHVINM